MKALCFALFISVAMSEYFIMTFDSAIYGMPTALTAIEFGKCNYISSKISSIYRKVSETEISITTYSETSNCEGDNPITSVYDITDESTKERLCTGMSCTLKIGDLPEYVAYTASSIDDGKCLHSDDAVKAYFGTDCLACGTDNKEYCKFDEEDGYLWLGVYPNNKCEKSERSRNQQMYRCGACQVSGTTSVKCFCTKGTTPPESAGHLSTISVMAIALFGIFAFFF
ncbi:hypothetical protein EDI_107460 [Entamoeba dispar SAW760]|uniref:Uncharacterized protein n=1 Tax=Entamoeba dispar (strain ATCC PRA-260 / SAW760) TaxID=370354 RepID=B0EGB4_ENTDS|nr:uncharacterized protein EDI_107460 [Entamoeba dispar SAW760]EDR26432.1 hypothetical protein EDI_107460 [Entamoeba dispar SAW760]|eukprot:EDR26432.1 hypothetical protein EDI_107460 [Entamoeba dispar SAW760]